MSEVSMVERVARAICRSFTSSDFEGDNIERIVEAEWQDWLSEARAAILAMREPTNEMVQAAIRADPLSCDIPDGGAEDVYKPVWNAMIDTALKE